MQIVLYIDGDRRSVFYKPFTYSNKYGGVTKPGSLLAVQSEAEPAELE